MHNFRFWMVTTFHWGIRRFYLPRLLCLVVAYSVNICLILGFGLSSRDVSLEAASWSSWVWWRASFIRFHPTCELRSFSKTRFPLKSKRETETQEASRIHIEVFHADCAAGKLASLLMWRWCLCSSCRVRVSWTQGSRSRILCARPAGKEINRKYQKIISASKESKNDFTDFASPESTLWRLAGLAPAHPGEYQDELQWGGRSKGPVEKEGHWRIPGYDI